MLLRVIYKFYAENRVHASMSRVCEKLSHQVFERDGQQIAVGENGDFMHSEIEALREQMRRWNIHHPKQKPVYKLSPEMLQAVLNVKRVFQGAVIEDWRKPI